MNNRVKNLNNGKPTPDTVCECLLNLEPEETLMFYVDYDAKALVVRQQASDGGNTLLARTEHIDLNNMINSIILPDQAIARVINNGWKAVNRAKEEEQSNDNLP